jgi:hypothetical protein
MMKAIETLALGVGMAISVPALALAQVANFDGWADHDGAAPGQYAPGVTYEAYTTLLPPGPGDDPSWYPFNADFFEYTLVIQGTVSSFTPGFVTLAGFSSVTFTVYEDDATAADYANKATLTDGAAILSGEISDMLAMHVTGQSFYTVSGQAHMTGGSGLGQLSCTTLLLNDFIQFTGPPPINPPAGYEEGYDPQWTCTPVPVEETNWGRVKSLYR